MTNAILSQIDDQITRLTEVRKLLAPLVPIDIKRGPGRPANAPKKRHRLSPEGRAAISAAMKARWAAKSKAQRKKAA